MAPGALLGKQTADRPAGLSILWDLFLALSDLQLEGFVPYLRRRPLNKYSQVQCMQGQLMLPKEYFGVCCKVTSFLDITF